MGRTPAKWLKTLLRGKKLSKSHLPKGEDVSKSGHKGEALVLSKTPSTDIIVETPSNSLPISVTNTMSEADFGKGPNAMAPNDANILSSDKDGNALTNGLALSEDTENERLQQAATKAQAVFRGYLARRSFRALKAIVRVQAFIRGRLVRKQAIATFYCVRGIVKIQKLARAKQGWELRNPSATGHDKLLEDVFIQKLLASSRPANPLHLQYGRGDPNSSYMWLERWTKFRFWEASSLPKENSHSYPQSKHQNLENEQCSHKQSVRRLPSTDIKTDSNGLSLESNKPKRYPRNFSGHIVDSVHDKSENEIEKLKLNLRRTNDFSKEVSDGVKANKKKMDESLGNERTSVTSLVLQQDVSHSSEVEQESKIEVLSQFELKENLKAAASEVQVDELQEHLAVVKAHPAEKMGPIEQKDASMNGKHEKSTHRRASLPAKIDQQENGKHPTTRVPSYMAPTESVKAKLRGQSSPRFAQGGIGMNGARRYSLPSSTNGEVGSFSPRALRLVEASGKGTIRSDKSLTSSRDFGEKLIKVEWRR
ncbi:protein IQ-DOMAIN 28-like [Rhodamnia argentea]|uniref:Protein IQ-DOMAIN 28-like n=1 Tax=Rhodamnia argentea TaxID=178133 RepID=A0A8B8QB64_9MYRT|nr:protein IQ-DOMAIN 28-like [Rhodamnia argentea]XP_030544370.2 protein IQ-DOMAIN 28-like [Rhodamnia argentea]XP_030544376.2 protein IQ-DOMAIN 28-like [Rhodamnia argentea]XP_030544385.2 protein IQ-DOMAIN 28-like [Rhodamnia argentea]XP_030544394.1 protein IQ-DOMAIN 28-like [Rhodamnia argentea]